MSAVIYAAIVVMWAVVLVPMWLRRHDAATESRSVDRFSTAMRTLSRRTTATPGRRYVVMPRRGEGRVSVHVSGAAAARAPQRTTASRPARGRTSLVARRRRLLLGLLVVTFVTFVLALVGVVSWPLQVVVDVIPVAFCIHLRAQARRAVAVARQRRRVTVAPTVPATMSSPTTGPAVAPPVEVAAVAEQPVAEQMVAATGTDDLAGDADSWEPVPVPPPTYTMKPPAPAFEADPTYAPPVYTRDPEPVAPGEEVIADPAAETDLDEILERRWAVND